MSAFTNLINKLALPLTFCGFKKYAIAFCQHGEPQLTSIALRGHAFKQKAIAYLLKRKANIYCEK